MKASILLLLLTIAPITTLMPFAISASTGIQNQPRWKQATDQDDLETFVGKIVSLNGALFILRDETDQVWYHLDDQTAASKFAGKNVKVKGKLDVATDVIHVQSIEEHSVLPNQLEN